VEHQQLEKFIYEHGEELLRLAYTYVKKHDVAEDLVQDVLLKAFEQREQFLGHASYRTYLYRMTINRCHDYFRSWTYRNTIVTEQITKFIKKPALFEQPGSEEESYLGHCLLSLPLKYREVLVLYYYKELSQEEIAELLSISINTVKTRMVRGRERLKKLLKEENLLGEIRSEEKY
jgi:RNA polymerase sigma factor (sigma-70 family)